VGWRGPDQRGEPRRDLLLNARVDGSGGGGWGLEARCGGRGAEPEPRRRRRRGRCAGLERARRCDDFSASRGPAQTRRGARRDGSFQPSAPARALGRLVSSTASSAPAVAADGIGMDRWAGG
jgi:hypothetical protein